MGPAAAESCLRVTLYAMLEHKQLFKNRLLLDREEAAMPSCPECENNLDIEMDEVEEGDVVACEECGTEYEVVGIEPLELARVEEETEEDKDYSEEEEEE